MKNTIELSIMGIASYFLGETLAKAIKREPINLGKIAQNSLNTLKLTVPVGLTFDIIDIVESETSNLPKKAEKVWKKGSKIPFYNANLYRKDKYGNLIKRTHYGNRSLKFSWELDHIKPKSKGGSDDLKNLQPLHYLENILKGNKIRYIPNKN